MKKLLGIVVLGLLWSSYSFAGVEEVIKEIKKNKDLAQGFNKVKELRRNNAFELHCVDDMKKYLNTSKKRLPNNLSKKSFFHFSLAEMTTFNGRICTQYKKMPLINPDLIYLDAPDQFNIKNKINNISTNHKDMMPMSCDILRIEHFLTPGTIIITDGRAANARFLKENLQRGWDYYYDNNNDQHLFFLNEKPLGIYSKRQLEFYRAYMVS